MRNVREYSPERPQYKHTVQAGPPATAPPTASCTHVDPGSRDNRGSRTPKRDRCLESSAVVNCPHPRAPRPPHVSRADPYSQIHQRNCLVGLEDALRESLEGREKERAAEETLRKKTAVESECCCQRRVVEAWNPCAERVEVALPCAPGCGTAAHHRGACVPTHRGTLWLGSGRVGSCSSAARGCVCHRL
mgnify:CR=1 FL=1|jgi:hypothetical protein